MSMFPCGMYWIMKGSLLPVCWKLALCLHSWQEVRHVDRGVTSPICDIHGGHIKVQLRFGKCPVWWHQGVQISDHGFLFSLKITHWSPFAQHQPKNFQQSFAGDTQRFNMAVQNIHFTFTSHLGCHGYMPGAVYGRLCFCCHCHSPLCGKHANIQHLPCELTLKKKNKEYDSKHCCAIDCRKRVRKNSGTSSYRLWECRRWNLSM